jgi:hypothetical protein
MKEGSSWWLCRFGDDDRCMTGDRGVGADVDSANGEEGSEGVGEVDVEGVGLLRRRGAKGSTPRWSAEVVEGVGLDRRRGAKDSTPTWSLGPGDSGGWRSTGMSLLLRLV